MPMPMMKTAGLVLLGLAVAGAMIVLALLANEAIAWLLGVARG